MFKIPLPLYITFPKTDLFETGCLTCANKFAHGVSLAIIKTQQLAILCTIWLFNIAMENGPFIDGLPIKNGDFPWLC